MAKSSAISLPAIVCKVLLDETVPWWFAQENEIRLINFDDKVVAKRPQAALTATSIRTIAHSIFRN